MNSNKLVITRDPKNILITGGCGFIGINFIRYLFSTESAFTGNIINIDKLTYASNPNALMQFSSSRYTFIHGDICDTILIKDILSKFDIDTICHFAAESHVDRSIHNGYPFIESNIKGTFTLLEAIRQYNPHIHFHHISTDEVFGSLTLTEPPFTERSPYAPNNPYSASKAGSDHLVRSYAHTYGITYTMSHSSNNYGLYQHEEKFIPKAIRQLHKKQPIPLYGDGSHIRDWIHVTDHVRAVWLILRYSRNNESYSIGARNELSNKELLYTLCKFYAQSIDVQNHQQFIDLITFVPDRPGHDARYAIDPSKIEQTLHWTPSVSLEVGLKNLMQYHIKIF
ncbi:dTDP-glucose 4,6-dehydratase [Entomospira entomophila]|uniref:dTDP-glucose 4,6-dehydratase n=1 Tax=Entomospira entomophila TaxID=2719988 RepID=A0A968G8G9_9SPIO|nr:dTDP-glucose 4,6-dehydratase [Entomospira entomophilus]NIZ40488.1 dTDP-glucose 4,6-dehydratase [Entomospira entomophilus]WDI36046.1 dTDP-glucose 4,6-dehydratase [Entomospira entomophilus]